MVGPAQIQIHISRETVTRFVEQPVCPTPARAFHHPIKSKIQIYDEEIVITARVELTCRRGRAQIIDGQSGRPVSVKSTEPKPALIQALVQAEFWRNELQKRSTQSLVEILQPHGVQPSYIRRLLNAAYLAPDIKRSVFQGTQPAEIQVQDLIKARSMDWEQQRQELGYSPVQVGAGR